MPKRTRTDATAAGVFEGGDMAALGTFIAHKLRWSGAVMIGQTRNGETLIVTVYQDDDRDKEYFDTSTEFNDWLEDQVYPDKA
jgi:hypothetical protein